MPIETGTITRYDATRAVREDLANIIYNISPTDVPFMSNIGRDTAKSTYTEWQTDNLANANANNAQFEGDQITAADVRAPTQRVGNYTQISRKVIEVSGTLEAVDKAGMRSYLAYELAKASAELKRDMESNLTGLQPAVPGNNTTARVSAGIGAWIVTNNQLGATGTAPVMSSPPLDGYPVTAAAGGTVRALTEALLKSGIQQVWTQGGDPTMVMVGPTDKVLISTFTGIATRFRDVPAGKQAQIIGAADVYVSDFGTVNIVPNRFMPNSVVYTFDPEYAAVSYLRNFRTEVMAKTGDAEKRMLLVEYTLKVRQQKAFGATRATN